MSNLQTKDYDMFKLTDINRAKGVNRGHVEKLKDSITAKNMLHLRPILVNSKMEILDGQHRYVAAKELGVPIHYTIDKALEDKDIICINETLPWRKEDYLNYYIKIGNQNYIEFDRFIREKELPVATGLIFCGYLKHWNSSEFKKGKLKFDREKAETFFNSIYRVVDVLKQVHHNKAFLTKLKFVKALSIVIAHPDVDYEILIRKCEMVGVRLVPALTFPEYITQLEYIYNYHNKNPIEIVLGRNYDISTDRAE